MLGNQLLSQMLNNIINNFDKYCKLITFLIFFNLNKQLTN